MLRVSLISAPLMSLPQPRQSRLCVMLRHTRKRSSRRRSMSFSSGEITLPGADLELIGIAESRSLLVFANRAAAGFDARPIPEERPPFRFAAK
jgi:hypothetical protein